MGALFGKDQSTPPPPDYAGAAIAQGQANKEATIAGSRLNNPNVNNPYGTQTWTESAGPRVFNQSGYDTALQNYNTASAGHYQTGPDGESQVFVPGTPGTAPNREDFYTQTDGEGRPTLTQTFSPEQQALYDKSVKSKGLLADLGIQGAGALQGVVGKNLDLSGAAPTPGSYENIRQKVIDAQMGRANEDYGKQTDQLNSDLVARGIRPGTKAYADSQQMIERSRNDARGLAEVAGGNAASQAYTQDADRRKQSIAEILAQRQTPLNEINALMSGSQVSNPFAVPGAAQNSNIAPAPIFGAAQAQDQHNTGVYNAQQASGNSFTNGLFSLGAAGLKAYGGIPF